MSTLDSATTRLRRNRLQEWIDQRFAGKQAHFLESIATHTGRAPNQGELSGLLSGKKSFGEKKARKLEIQAGMPAMYLDTYILGVSSSTSPVSLSDATTREDVFTGVRKVRIEGAVAMDERGFWDKGTAEAEEASYPTDDPDAYAIRILSQRFQPVLGLGQCILVSPSSSPKPGRPVVIILMDGRRTLRNFQSHERGVWSFTDVSNANDYLNLSDEEVAYVERVMAYLWTD